MNKKELHTKMLIRSLTNCIDKIDSENCETVIVKAFNDKSSIGLYQVQITVTKDQDSFLHDFEYQIIE